MPAWAAIRSPRIPISTHAHPDSVMLTLSSFRRRLSAGGRDVDVELLAGVSRWLSAQEHSGENIGETPTHAIFVELKEAPVSASATEVASAQPLGSDAGSAT